MKKSKSTKSDEEGKNDWVFPITKVILFSMFFIENEQMNVDKHENIVI